MRLWPFKLEIKSLANPTDEEIALFTGGVIGTVRLADALTVPAVQRAVKVISEAGASLDIRVEQFDGTAWVQDHDHPVAVLLAGQPNGWSSTFDLIRDLIAAALCYDKGGLAFVGRNSERKPIEIIRYDAAHFHVDYSADGRQEPSFKINNKPVAADSVIHLRAPLSKCPVSLASDAIATAKQLEKYAFTFFKNAARPGGVVQFPKGVGEAAVQKMKAAWKAAFSGAENAGNTPVLYDGGTFNPMSMTSTDSQFLENRKEQTVEIARAMSVPPPMLFEMGRATWANGEQQGKEFLSYALEGWLQSLEGSMRRALFDEDERKTWRIRFDRDDLTRADLTARATAISSLISSRVLNPNEGREWLGLGPRAGGEEYANPNTGANQPGPAEKPADPPRSSAQPPDNDEDDDRDAA